MTPDELELLRAWVPVAADFSANEPWVRWADLRGVELDEPFFDQSVQRALSTGDGELVESSPEEMIEGSRAKASPGPSAFLFHSGRCGSTLLASAIGCADEVLVVKEPVSISQALLSDPGARQPEWLRALLLCLTGRSAGCSRCVVKFSSWNILYFTRLTRLFPNVPCMFVYRDPVETIVSLLEKPPAWIRELRCGLLPVKGSATAGVEETYARFVAGMYEAALAAPSLQLMNYAELCAETIVAAGEGLGMRFGPGARGRIEQIAGRYSKAPASEARFLPDADLKQRRASPALRAAVRRWASAPYDRLQRRRG